MKMSFKKISKLVGMLLLAGVIVQGCSDVAGPGDGVSSTVAGCSDGLNGDGGGFGGDDLECTTSGSSVLKASNKSYDAGTVEYEIVGDNLIVTYVPADGVAISETHLWVGVDINDMSASGNGAPLFFLLKNLLTIH